MNVSCTVGHDGGQVVARAQAIVSQVQLQGVGDGVAGAHLEAQCLVGGIKQVVAVECAASHDTVHLVGQFRVLTVQVHTVGGVQGAVFGLNSQLTHTLQVVADLAHGAVGHLQQRDTVVGVAPRHIKAANLRLHALGNGQACCVVFGAVHTQSGGQASDRVVQTHARA